MIGYTPAMDSHELKPQSWTVEASSAGERLDHFLTERLSTLSRSQIQKLIVSGQVTVSGKAPTKHRFLKTGDTIVFDAQSVDRPPAGRTGKAHGQKKIPSRTSHSTPSTLRLDDLIVEETDSYIVLDKPVGLLVHPDSKTEHGTLVDALIAHDPKIAKVGENPERPGIVHRLDREVSGLMVVAKTQDAFDALKKQFASRETHKTYLALVHGDAPHEEGDLKFRIARSTTSPRMAARPEGESKGKAAWTHYRTLERLNGATLLELQILSGRTHQIRAHLLAFGHPVMGDHLYIAKRPDRNMMPPRLMLQSTGLSFLDPDTGTRREYRLEPDAVFDEMKKRLAS